MSRARLATLAVGAAVVALIALGAAAASAAIGYDAPFGGFFVYRSGAVTSLWRADWPGRRAGLRVRDVVVAVDGEPVAGGPALAAALERRRGRAAVTLDVARPDGSRPRVTVPLGRLTKWDRASTFALPFSIGLVYLLLGATIFRYKRTREAALACALCLVAAAFYLSMFDAHTTWRFTRVWLLYPLLGPLSVHLFACFPEVRPRWARRAVLWPLYAVGLGVVAWRQWAIDDPRASDVGSLVTAAMLSAEFACDLGLLGSSMTGGATPSVRNRAKSIFVGLALTCTTAVAWQFASRLAGPSSWLTADQAMVLSALFPALIAYAILKRNLFDLDAVLRASFIYGVATALVLGLYFAVVAVASHWATMLVGQAFAVALTLAVAVVFHPLRLGVQRIVDRLLYRDSRMPALLELLRALPTVEDVPSLAEVALGPLLRLTRARGVLLLVPSPLGRLDVAGRAGEGLAADELHLPLGGAFEELLRAQPQPQSVRELGDDSEPSRAQLARVGVELLVPLVHKRRLTGLLAFSPPRGGVYGYGVVHTLADAAPQLALALENAALVAERALRERLAALGQLAAVIVHEVKNPLGIIKVSAGALRQRARDEAAVTLCACIEDEVDRMDATARRLLDLARPDEPALQPTDVGALIKQTLERLGPELEAAHIQVRCELSTTPRVSADAEEIRRALFNLFLNAREAMPSGGALSVRLRPAPDLAELVEIEVEDSGVGMDESTRRQLFRPFFTTRHGGTGLGLAIVKRVVENHRGAIRVESRLGQGSRFTLTLPR
jgi:signal transduction histidine kinase